MLLLSIGQFQKKLQFCQKKQAVLLHFYSEFIFIFCMNFEIKIISGLASQVNLTEQKLVHIQKYTTLFCTFPPPSSTVFDMLHITKVSLFSILRLLVLELRNEFERGMYMWEHDFTLIWPYTFLLPKTLNDSPSPTV